MCYSIDPLLSLFTNPTLPSQSHETLHSTLTSRNKLSPTIRTRQQNHPITMLPATQARKSSHRRSHGFRITRARSMNKAQARARRRACVDRCQRAAAPVKARTQKYIIKTCVPIRVYVLHGGEAPTDSRSRRLRPLNARGANNVSAGSSIQAAGVA